MNKTSSVKKFYLLFLFVFLSSLCFSQTRIGKDSLSIKIYTKFRVNKEGVVDSLKIIKVDCLKCNQPQSDFIIRESNNVLNELRNKKFINNEKVSVMYSLPIDLIISKKEFNKFKE